MKRDLPVLRYLLLLAVCAVIAGDANAQGAGLPDGRLFLPPPPAAGSAAFMQDQEIFRRTRALKDTPRWRLAAADAKVSPAYLIRDFSCVVGFDLNPDRLPRLLALFETIRSASEDVVSTEKHHWSRARPFVGTDEPICTPDERLHLSLSSSYPSGHATFGWLGALVFVQLFPDRATDILERGRVYAESRAVCGAHWYSDVQAGYMNASALYAALQGDAAFQHGMQAAREELSGYRREAGAPDAAMCRVEKEAGRIDIR